jgi:hypothetical protein
MLAKQHYNKSQSKQPNMRYHEDQSANDFVDMDAFDILLVFEHSVVLKILM